MSLALNVTYDNTDSLFQYSNISNRPIGDWGLTRHEDYHGGSMAVNKFVGGTISWRFHGIAFTILGDKVDDHGSFQISIDDEVIGNYSGYADVAFDRDNRDTNKTLFASEVLDYGLHRVEYLNLGAQSDEETGNYAVLDSVQVQIRGEDDATSTRIGSASEHIPTPSESSDSVVSSSEDTESISGGGIAGAVVGAVVGGALLGFLAWFFLRRKRREASEAANRGWLDDSSYSLEAGMTSAPPLRQRTDSEIPRSVASHTFPGGQSSHEPSASQLPSSLRLQTAGPGAGAPVTFTVANPEQSPVAATTTESSGTENLGNPFETEALISNDQQPSGSRSAGPEAHEAPPSYSAAQASSSNPHSAKGQFSDFPTSALQDDSRQ